MSSSLLMQGYHNGTLLPTQTLIFGYPVLNLKPDVLYKIRFDSMRCICSCNRYNKLIVKSSVCLFLALTIKILALSPYLPLQIRPKPLFYLIFPSTYNTAISYKGCKPVEYHRRTLSSKCFLRNTNYGVQLLLAYCTIWIEALTFILYVISSKKY